MFSLSRVIVVRVAAGNCQKRRRHPLSRPDSCFIGPMEEEFAIRSPDAADRPLDVGVGGRTAFVEGGLDGRVEDMFAGVAQFAPFRDAAIDRNEGQLYQYFLAHGLRSKLPQYSEVSKLACISAPTPRHCLKKWDTAV